MYNKTETNLQSMFNGYIKTTTYSLFHFPETLGTFWWNPFHFILNVFKYTVCWKMYNFFGPLWHERSQTVRTERQTTTLEVWGRRGNQTLTASLEATAIGWWSGGCAGVNRRQRTKTSRVVCRHFNAHICSSANLTRISKVKILN